MNAHAGEDIHLHSPPGSWKSNIVEPEKEAKQAQLDAENRVTPQGGPRIRARASRKKTAKSTAPDPEKCTTPRGGPSKRARNNSSRVRFLTAP